MVKVKKKLTKPHTILVRSTLNNHFLYFEKLFCMNIHTCNIDSFHVPLQNILISLQRQDDFICEYIYFPGAKLNEIYSKVTQSLGIISLPAKDVITTNVAIDLYT